MTKTLITVVSLSLLGSVAHAQPAVPTPPPTPAPAAPTAPADSNAPVAPADPNTPTPAAEAAPEPTPESAPASVEPPAPAPVAPQPVAGGRPFDDLAVSTPHVSAPQKSNPKIAIELSGTGAYIANPYVVYRGWTLENGAPKGFRLEANLIGIQVAYELSSMSNTEACGPSGCISGDFGSTTFHALDVGYRLRFSQIGPVRPFLAASLAAVRANAGDWSPMTSSGSVWGGALRSGVGIEVPIVAKVFASATLAYRLLITENPLDDADEADAQTFLVGVEKPNGDFAEDIHMLSAYVGVGIEL